MKSCERHGVIIGTCCSIVYLICIVVLLLQTKKHNTGVYSLPINGTTAQPRQALRLEAGKDHRLEVGFSPRSDASVCKRVQKKWIN